MKEHIFNKFISNILQPTGLTRSDFFYNSKNLDIGFSRQTLFYLCIKRGLTTAMIKQYMENNECFLTRPPITYGVSIVENLLKEDEDLQNVIDKLSVVD